MVDAQRQLEVTSSQIQLDELYCKATNVQQAQGLLRLVSKVFFAVQIVVVHDARLAVAAARLGSSISCTEVRGWSGNDPGPSFPS